MVDNRSVITHLIYLKHLLHSHFSILLLFTQISKQIRSEIIATYALCGFSNFSSIGIQIGGMGPLAPSRKEHMAAIALRTLAAGTIACLMTACVAGEICNLFVVVFFFQHIYTQIRSEIIATYALCGFSNIASIGVVLGGLGPMAKSRVPDMSKVAIRALVAGTIACLMTACIAGEV